MSVDSSSGVAKTIICLKSEIKGNVIFGQGCIVHPNSTISAEGGDIVFGDFNIIEERVLIVNKQNLKDPSKNKPMNIGSFNLFEVGCRLENSDVGDSNHFEPRAHIEADCRIKSKCTIGATVKVPSGTSIDEKKIYFPDKVVKELNYDEQRFRRQIINMYTALAQLIPANNPVKEI